MKNKPVLGKRIPKESKTIKVWDKKAGGLVSFTPSPTKIVRVVKQGGLTEEIPINRKERRKLKLWK